MWELVWYTATMFDMVFKSLIETRNSDLVESSTSLCTDTIKQNQPTNFETKSKIF